MTNNKNFKSCENKSRNSAKVKDWTPKKRKNLSAKSRLWEKWSTCKKPWTRKWTDRDRSPKMDLWTWTWCASMMDKRKPWNHRELIKLHKAQEVHYRRKMPRKFIRRLAFNTIVTISTLVRNLHSEKIPGDNLRIKEPHKGQSESYRSKTRRLSKKSRSKTSWSNKWKQSSRRPLDMRNSTSTKKPKSIETAAFKRFQSAMLKWVKVNWVKENTKSWFKKMNRSKNRTRSTLSLFRCFKERCWTNVRLPRNLSKMELVAWILFSNSKEVAFWKTWRQPTLKKAKIS